MYQKLLNFQLEWDLNPGTQEAQSHSGKLVRLWTPNPECQGSSPIQVENLISN